MLASKGPTPPHLLPAARPALQLLCAPALWWQDLETHRHRNPTLTPLPPARFLEIVATS